VPSRAAAMATLDAAVERAQKAQRERESGQTSLFSLLGGGGAGGAAQSGSALGPPPPYPQVPEWSPRERLAAEKESLGFYISGHPMDRYAPDLARARAMRVEQALAESGSPAFGGGRERTEVIVGGVVSDYRERPLKSGGGRMCTFKLEDQTGNIEVVCFSKPFADYEEILKSSEPLIITGNLVSEGDSEGEQRRIHLREAQLLSRLRREKTQRVVIELGADSVTRDQVEELHKVLRQHHGHVPVSLRLVQPARWRVEARLPAHLCVMPSDECLQALEVLVGRESIQLR
jgi:DNA polymerase-3 subunit alpha